MEQPRETRIYASENFEVYDALTPPSVGGRGGWWVESKKEGKLALMSSFKCKFWQLRRRSDHAFFSYSFPSFSSVFGALARLISCCSACSPAFVDSFLPLIPFFDLLILFVIYAVSFCVFVLFFVHFTVLFLIG